MAGETFKIKQGDTAPSIQETLYLGGVVINLTGATILFRLFPEKNVTPKINAGVATLVGAGTAGTVQYAWQASDTNTSGVFRREWQITFPDASILTVPNDVDGYLVIITKALA